MKDLQSMKDTKNGDNFATKLKEYLKGKGYDEMSMSERTLIIYGNTYVLIEIRAGEYIIQSFVLMSDKHRNSIHRLPFYKTYLQETPKGALIYPACCIACLNDDGWHFFNASETCQPMKKDFVDYLKAKERFVERLNMEIKKSNMSKLTKHSRIAGCLLIVFLVAYFIINKVFIVNSNVICLLITSFILFLLPDFLKVIQKFAYGDIEVYINKDIVS